MLLVQSVTQEITCFEIVPNSTAILLFPEQDLEIAKLASILHTVCIYIRTVETNPLFSFGKFDSFLAGLVWAEIECTVHVA